MTWLIATNEYARDLETFDSLGLRVSGNGFKLFASEPLRAFGELANKCFVSIEGTLLPRISKKEAISRNQLESSIVDSYLKNGNELVNNLKGNFTLLVGNNEGFSIFSDRLGIAKFYYHTGPLGSLVSNNLQLIASKIGGKINANHIAIFSLTNRFPGGITMYSDIYYSKAASCFTFSSEFLSTTTYWNVDDLFNSQVKSSSFKEYASVFQSVVKQYIDFFNPNEISLTLTGGSDSRILLGSLLKLGKLPKTFTFGNPRSGDVIVAKHVANSLGLVHNHYFEEKPSPQWFQSLAEVIKLKGNSLINYHRSYRLDGILKDKKTNPCAEITIVGHGGGEPIRGLFYDNLIVTNFVKDWSPSLANKKEIISTALAKRYINVAEVDIDYVIGFLDSLPYLQASGKLREFRIIFQLLIETHLYQDLNLYMLEHKTLVTPFLDIDYLEYLFSSPFSMLFKNNTSKNQLKRLNIPALHCNVINNIYPELCTFQLNNGYSPNEYLRSKYLYFIQRTVRKMLSKPKESNFYYDQWFNDFVLQNWPKEPNPLLGNIFDLARAKEALNTLPKGRTEGFWVQFSSIVMLNQLANQF